MKGDLGILRNSLYGIVAMALMGGCSHQAPKNTDLSGAKTNSNIPQVQTPATDQGTPHVYTISIRDMKFQPDKIEASKGDSVIWRNNDLVAHCVTEMPDKTWSSSVIAPGQSWKMVITKSSEYNCSIHPVMKGKIVMK